MFLSLILLCLMFPVKHSWINWGGTSTFELTRFYCTRRRVLCLEQCATEMTEQRQNTTSYDCRATLAAAVFKYNKTFTAMSVVSLHHWLWLLDDMALVLSTTLAAWIFAVCSVFKIYAKINEHWPGVNSFYRLTKELTVWMALIWTCIVQGGKGLYWPINKFPLGSIGWWLMPPWDAGCKSASATLILIKL